MRFRLHQQNYKPNSTAGRHKAAGINLAGASHPQLPKAQYARGPEIQHTRPVLCVVCVQGAEPDFPEQPLWQRAQDTLCSTTVPLRAKSWASTHRAELNSAHTSSTSQGGKGRHRAALQPTARDWTASRKSSLAKGDWGGLTDKEFYWVLSRCHLEAPKTSWYSHINILQSLIVKRNSKKKTSTRRRST